MMHITVLDADTPVPNVYAERGLYSDIFASLLREAYSKTPGLPELDLKFTKYDCVLGILPSEEDLLKTNAIIITGSAASAYDQVPWISNLTDFIRQLYTNHSNIKIFGSCFGHQLLCNALFSTPSNQVVEHDPAGWELGVYPITLSEPFLAHYGPVTSNPSNPTQLRMQFVHADHVVLSTIPSGFHSIGRSAHCILQGVWQQGRVLTYQGHAEFDRFTNGETVKVFGRAWEEAFMRDTLKGVDKDDDAVWAARVMLMFFLEDRVEERAEDVRVANENVTAML